MVSKNKIKKTTTISRFKSFLLSLFNFKIKNIKDLNLLYRKTDKELKARIFYGFFICLFSFLAIYFGGTIYMIYLFIIFILSIKELNSMLENIKTININIYNKYKKNSTIYLIVSIICMILLRMQAEGLKIVLWLFIVVFTFDASSYIFGKKFGKIPLYPTVSPSKTIEGFVCGIFCGLIVSSFVRDLLVKPSKVLLDQRSFFTITLLILIFAQIGDLIESWLKRFCKVKDSGTILSKHGGVMDRFDSLMFSGILLYIITFFLKGRLFNL